MDKIFAIENGIAYFNKDDKWHKCNVTENGIEVLGETEDISPVSLFNSYEVIAKVPKGAPIKVPKPKGKPKEE